MKTHTENKDLKNLKKFGSVRLTAYLTPDTFLKKIMIIDTTIRMSDNRGETAIAHAEALNYTYVPDFHKLDWEVIKEHKSIEEAISFHNKLILSKKWTDCKEIDR